MQEKNSCYNCSKYHPYYTKGYIKFDMCDLGLCGASKKTVEKHDSCEKFSYKNYARIGRKSAALAAVTEHVNILAELKQILEEDDEELLGQLLADYKSAKQKGR